MKIGEAARRSGVSPRALRYYEEEGLIESGRSSNGFRDYCPATIERVRVVRSLLDTGLSVRLVREVMPYLAQVSREGRVCPEFLAEVREYRDRLAARIAQLSATQSALDAFLDENGA
ncbi:MerR family transcriptional regulator [Streptomyces sp. HUAS TT7]|uniref:MerR family transcriptional regulator n=1 Tax=Streptomyces sp. HUAS TT7 TaxID=3447507 RepID=UPI003F65E604